MKKIIYCIAICGLCMSLLTSCLQRTIPTGGTSTPNTTNTNVNYDEDLSAVRPKYASKPKSSGVIERKAEPQVSPVSTGSLSDLPYQVTTKVNASLDADAARNRAVQYTQGYKIQVYVGNNRQDVENAKVFIYQRFPELSPYMTYTQPTYRLKIGDFLNKADADRYLSQLKDQFVGSLVLSDKIEIRKSLLIK